MEQKAFLKMMSTSDADLSETFEATYLEEPQNEKQAADMIKEEANEAFRSKNDMSCVF